MSLTQKLIYATTWLSYRRFEAATRDPQAAQARQWLKTWNEIGGSPFWSGRMSGSPDLSEFPITEYSDYVEALQQALETGVSPFSASRILHFADSSASTGKKKHFPITASYHKQFQTTMPPFLHGIIKRFPKFMSAPVLYFASPRSGERSRTGIELGPISGFNYRNISPVLKKFYALPSAALESPELLAKWGPLYALATDLSAIFAVTPSIVEAYTGGLRARFEELLPYLEGKMQPPAPLPPVTIAPARLQNLKIALQKNPVSLREIWPSLQFVCCWKSSTCGLQLARLEKYLQGQVPVIDAIYSATEAWINVPLSNGAGGPLHPNALIAEFIPAELAVETKNIVPAWELQPDREYEILLTTRMGFVRYRLRDLVRCTGFFNLSPIVEFSGRAESEINLGLVRVSEGQLLSAANQTGLASESNWVFGPAAEGDHIVLYCARLTDAIRSRIEGLHRELIASNEYYRMYTAKNYVKPLRPVALGESHPVFNRPQNAQTKPLILVTSPLAAP